MSFFMSVCGTVLLALMILLCAVLMLLLLVFFSKIRFFFKYKEKLEILLKIWFIKINITKLTSKQRKQKKPKKVQFTGELFGEFPEKPQKERKVRKKSESTATTATTEEKEKKTISETLELIKDILSDISSPLAKCIDVKIHKLYVTAAAKEAADTAIMFGHMNTAVGSLILICKKFKALDINVEKTGVYSDFNAEKASLDAEIELALSVKHIGITGFTALMSYLKNRKQYYISKG